MGKRAVNSERAFAAVGPYSHSVLVNEDMLFTSGTIGADPASGELKETLEEQVIQTFANLGAILDESGMNFDNVVKTTVFLRDMNDFAVANRIYAEYFLGDKPARSTVAVVDLPMGALYELEAIAVR